MATRPLAVKFTTEGFQEAIQSLKQVGRSFDDALAKAQKSAQDAIAESKKGIGGAGLEEATKKFEKAARDANAAIQGSFRELRIKSTADVEAMKAQAVSAFEAIKKSGTASAQDVANAQAALTKRLKELDAQLDQTEKTAVKAGQGYSVFGNIVANLATNLITGAISKVQQLSGSVIQAGANAERQQVAFETFLGSAQAAQEMMAKVRDLAATTPFELPEVTDAAKQLLAVKTPADEVVDTIRRLGEIAAGADKPLSQLLFIYTQVKNQGRATGEDINQLLNAGLSMEDIAKALGKSAEELGRMKGSSEGLQLSFEEVQKVILGVTSEGGRFAGLMDKLGDTTAVNLSNLNDAFTKLYLQIYDAIAPALSAVLDIIVQTLDPLSENESIFEGIKKQAEEFRDYITQNPEIIKSLNDALIYTLNTLFKGLATTARQLLDYLQRNPDAVQKLADKLKFVADIMNGILWVINKAIEGWMMIFDLVGKTWQLLQRPAFQFGGAPQSSAPTGNQAGGVPYGPSAPTQAGGDRSMGASSASKPTSGANSKQKALIEAANKIGMTPLELAAIISFETGGSFNPAIRGGGGNKYIGLIQFGPNEQKKYGAHQGQSFEEQISGPVVRYFQDRGFKPGMGGLLGYTTVLRGSPNMKLIDLPDGFGTTARRAYAQQLSPGKPHYRSAQRFLSGAIDVSAPMGMAADRGIAVPIAANDVERQRRQERKRQDAEAKRLGKEDVNQFGNIFQDMLRERKAQLDDNKEAFGEALTEGFKKAKEGFKEYQENLKFLDENLKKVKQGLDEFKISLLPDSPEKEALLSIKEINERYAEFTERIQENLDKLNAVIAAKERNNLSTTTEKNELQQLNSILAETNTLREQELQQIERQLQLEREKALNSVAGYGYGNRFAQLGEQSIFNRAAEILGDRPAEAVDSMTASLQTLSETLTGSAADSLNNFFGDLFTGTQSAGDAFANMAKSILNSLGQIASRMIVSSIFGGLGLSLPGFAEGGFTGNGPKYKLAGAVHAGEYVFSADAVRNIGVNTLNRLHSGARSPLALPLGFGSSSAPMGSRNVSITTTVVTPNADSFNKTERQIGREQGEAIRRAMA